MNAAEMEDEMIRLKAFLTEEVTAVVSLNNIGLHLELEDGRNIWDWFRVPFFNIMMVSSADKLFMPSLHPYSKF